MKKPIFWILVIIIIAFIIFIWVRHKPTATTQPPTTNVTQIAPSGNANPAGNARAEDAATNNPAQNTPNQEEQALRANASPTAADIANNNHHTDIRANADTNLAAADNSAAAHQSANANTAADNNNAAHNNANAQDENSAPAPQSTDNKRYSNDEAARANRNNPNNADNNAAQ